MGINFSIRQNLDHILYLTIMMNMRTGGMKIYFFLNNVIVYNTGVESNVIKFLQDFSTFIMV